MHLPPFDRAEMTWDAWQAFHIGFDRTFVQFDTGEFVACSRNWSPEDRRLYPSFRLRIVATNDDKCPHLYVPHSGRDKPIPRSHLSRKGQQTLLLDLDSKRAVGLYPWLTQNTAPQVPERFTAKSSYNVAAYYAGPNAFPVGAPIAKHYPHPLAFNQRRHVDELTDACKVWLQMQPDPNALRQEYMRGFRHAPNPIHFLDMPFSTLTEIQRMAIVVEGFDMIAEEKYPFLTFD
jgi:hypothetical protein